MTVASQLTVSASPNAFVPGQEYDLGYNHVVSMLAAEDIPFGAYVAITAESQCELPDSAGEVNPPAGGGIALLDHTKGSPRDGLTVPGYKQGDMVRVLVRGAACVLSEEALAIGDTLFVRQAAGAGGTQKGAFRNDADTASATTPTNLKLHHGGGINQAIVIVNGP